MIVSAPITVVPPVIPLWWSGRVLLLHAIPVAVGLVGVVGGSLQQAALLDGIRRVTGNRPGNRVGTSMGGRSPDADFKLSGDGHLLALHSHQAELGSRYNLAPTSVASRTSTSPTVRPTARMRRG
jgi:hypothetical protein